MSDLGISSIDDLRAGDVVTFESMRQLSSFEDMVAETVHEQVSKAFPDDKNKLDAGIWNQRDNIAYLWRVKAPGKTHQWFNGTLGNIAMEVMGYPYQQLLDAYNDREVTLNKLVYRPEVESNKKVVESIIGFALTAEARSNSNLLGQLQARWWLCPQPFRTIGGKEARGIGPASTTVRRIVTKAQIDTGAASPTWPDTARVVGFGALQALQG